MLFTPALGFFPKRFHSLIIQADFNGAQAHTTLIANNRATLFLNPLQPDTLFLCLLKAARAAKRSAMLNLLQ